MGASGRWLHDTAPRPNIAPPPANKPPLPSRARVASLFLYDRPSRPGIHVIFLPFCDSSPTAQVAQPGQTPQLNIVLCSQTLRDRFALQERPYDTRRCYFYSNTPSHRFLAPLSPWPHSSSSPSPRNPSRNTSSAPSPAAAASALPAAAFPVLAMRANERPARYQRPTEAATARTTPATS